MAEQTSTGTAQTSNTPAQTSQGTAPAAGTTPAAAAAPVAAAAPKSTRWKPVLNAAAQLLETKERVKTLEPKAAQLDALLKKAKEDPLGFLQDGGLDWGTLAAAKARSMLPGGAGGAAAATAAAAAPAPEVKELQTQLGDLTKRLGETETARATADKQAKEQAWQGFVSSVDEAVTADAEKYPALVATKNTHLVVEEIQQQFAKDKTLLTASEAAVRVEARVRAQLTELVKANPKLAELLGLPAAATGPKEAPSAVKVRARPSSLSAVPAVATPSADANAAKPVVKKEQPSSSRTNGGRFTKWLKDQGRVAE